MFLFWIELNHLSKVYVALKRDPYQTLSSTCALTLAVSRAQI